MDNLCHTLVGAACARAGLVRPTRLATATSMIAANLPDLDVLVFATDVPSVAFRRGWTHGVLAQALLPLLLAGAACFVGRHVLRRRADGLTAELGPLLALSYLGVLVHVLMDYLNNYGVRLLMPVSREWLYGDAVFIVDPWLWTVLAAGLWLGRRGRVRRVRTALAVAAAYVVAMIGSAQAARALVTEAWVRAAGAPPAALMVGPVPVSPFRKAVIVDAGDHYRTGTFSWWTRQTVLSVGRVPKNDDHPAVARARRDPRVAGILVWARFPFWEVAPAAGGAQVTVKDMRFADIGRGGFSATTTVDATSRP